MKRRQPSSRVKLNPHAVWELLNRLNMTQNELATRVGTSSGYLSQMMSGTRCPLGGDAQAPHGGPGRHPIRGPLHPGGRVVKSGLLPFHLILDDGLIPEDFAERLDAFKEATGLSWEALAACLGVDPRQLQRRRKGTKPSGDGLCALVLLAARIPGGLYTLLGVHVIPPVGVYQPPLAVGFGLNGKEG